MAAAGFVYRDVASIDAFLDGPDGPDGRVRDGVHLIFAGETVRPGELLPNPDVSESESAGAFRVLQLRPLVGTKLTAYCDEDRAHLRDLLEVGLIDASWGRHYPGELAGRLRGLVDTPGG